MAATKKAADAADINAKIALAQAIPRIRIIRVDLSEWTTVPSNPDNNDVAKSATPVIVVTNFGSTDATVPWLVTDRAVGSKPPTPGFTTPEGQPWSMVGGMTIIAAQKQATFTDSAIKLSDEQFTKITTGEWKLWFWGVIRVRDFLSREKDYGFIFEYSPVAKRFEERDIAGFTFQHEHGEKIA